MHINLLFSYGTINTGIDSINSITLLGDKTAVICGNGDRILTVKSYNLQTTVELNSLCFKDANGVAGVKLGGKRVLAVSYRLVKKA